MRTVYQHQLDTMQERLQGSLEQATDNLELATNALLNVDLSAAEQVISRADKFSAEAQEIARLMFDLLALEAPAINDLRPAVAGLSSVNDARHMTAHALRIAELARDHHPDCCAPTEAIGLIQSMSRLAVMEGRTAVLALSELDSDTARWLSEHHLSMYDYREAILGLVRSPDCTFTPRQSADLALLAHHLEGFGDCAVDSAECIIYMGMDVEPDLEEIAEQQ